MPLFHRFAALARPAALAALAAASLVPATAAAEDEAQSPLVASAEPMHRGIYPIRRYTPAQAQMSLPELPTTCRLTYQGGPVISQVQIVIVNWGATVDASVQAYTPGFFQAVLKSPYMDWLQEYNTPGGQTICRGSYVKAVTITPTNNTKRVSDSEIGPEIAKQIAAGTLPAPALDKQGHANTLYFVYFGPGVTISMDDGSSSCVQFCGYHSDGSYQNKTFPYAVIPDLGGACANGCGSGASKAENVGIVSSHELIEAVTDTNVGINDVAWYQDGANGSACNGEIGDICVGAGDTVTVNGYKVQLEWSNKQKKCTSSGTGYTPCGGCTTNAECAAPTAVCKTATGDCVACVANTDCSGATPVCDQATNACKACSADADCPGAHCATSGANAGKCVACVTNKDCSNPTPVCSAAGTCGGCTGNADCSGNSAGSTCNTSTGACGAAGSSGSSGNSSGSSGGSSGGGSSGSSGGGSNGSSGNGDNNNGDSPSGNDSPSSQSGCAASPANGTGYGTFGLALVTGLAIMTRRRRRA